MAQWKMEMKMICDNNNIILNNNNNNRHVI